MTIEELLTQPALHDVNFLAGQNGQSSIVTTVQTIETNRIEKYQQAQMLYLLDSLELLENNDKMRRLITQLAHSKAAGIVVMKKTTGLDKSGFINMC